MTKLEQVARQALEALREYRDTQMISAPRKAIEALREALAEPDIEEMTLTQIAAKYEQAEQSSYAATSTTLAEPVAWDNPRADEIVTGLYRKFKEWSQRGFGADDVTWCDVKAEINRLIELYAAPVRTKDLTDEEIMKVAKGINPENYTIGVARAVIAADREKNK